MICTLWTPFEAKRYWQIHTEGLSKFHSNIYSILYDFNYEWKFSYFGGYVGGGFKFAFFSNFSLYKAKLIFHQWTVYVKHKKFHKSTEFLTLPCPLRNTFPVIRSRWDGTITKCTIFNPTEQWSSHNIIIFSPIQVFIVIIQGSRINIIIIQGSWMNIIIIQGSV